MLINIVDVVDGALVNAIALTGRRVSVAVDGLRGRRRAADGRAPRRRRDLSRRERQRP